MKFDTMSIERVFSVAIAVSEQAILLTQDKDFGELVVRLGMQHCGIVLIRLAGMTAQVRAQSVSELVRNHASELPGALTPVSGTGFLSVYEPFFSSEDSGASV
jgi:hypothetical protein